ncbi:hypothetical protein CFAM422_010134 [Trichoderma lentiforme]|uniref:Uncharacterized protein n=1 Tax=Trichoderma lentiforme TaxID=1567552 RepID=A0A9P5C9Z9_9HYPO|nr:hypothetical protein CFAM422_010134 [Trichoderma lentiforme]
MAQQLDPNTSRWVESPPKGILKLEQQYSCQRDIFKNLSTHPSLAASQMRRLDSVIGMLTVDETSSIISANDFADQIRATTL